MASSVKLPLFPLQLVVFPGEELNLHIFEPRYRQLISDTEVSGQTFGIPTVLDGKMMKVATEVKLLEVSKRYPSGESDVKTAAKRVFFLENYETNLGKKLYAGGNVRFVDLDMAEDPVINEEIILLTKEIYRRLRVDREVKEAAEGFCTYDIAHYVGMSREQEYELLTLFNALDRQQFLLEHLHAIRPEIEERLDIRAKALMNGHFKHLSPPNF
ncbi:MAG: LON peptidase substrate-binding domain-containing protein [Bacteroidota bacterium]